MNSPWLVCISLVIAQLAAVEAYGWYYHGTAGTLSAHVRVWSYEHPIIIPILVLLVLWLGYHFWNAKDMAAVATTLTANR